MKVHETPITIQADFPVKYNGKTDSYLASDDPRKLEKGKIYWVTKVIQNNM